MGGKPCSIYLAIKGNRMTKAEFQKYGMYLQHRFMPLCILFVSIGSIVTSIQYKTGLPAANTTLWWVLQAFVLYIFFISKKHFFDVRQAPAMLYVLLYLWWNVFSLARGVFIAENYWDWKVLVFNGMGLLIPVVAYVATNTALMQSIFKYYLKYTLLLILGFSFLIFPDAYGYYLVPISFLVLFFPLLNLRWKLILLAITIFVITVDLGARSNVIKFAVPVLLSLIYYFRFYLSIMLFERIRKLLFIAPFILFTLAATDTFNIFNMNDYVGSDYSTIGVNVDGDAIDDDLKADTRTFLYVEVLQTAEKYNTWLIGRSPARGNESVFFGMDDMTGRGERAANEVGILNVFTWTGIVGVLLYCLAFYRASYLAINQSNNTFSQIMGLFVAFRWVYAWVEDVNFFSLTTVFLWLLIGLCYSKHFRSMTNKDVEFWVQGIFYNKKVAAK